LPTGRWQRGITLVEVMAALAIVAVAMAAAMRASGAATENADAYRQRLLARWVAGNVLAEAQLERPMPAVGVLSGKAAQAGEGYLWTRSVSETPNPRFRRVDIVVRRDGDAAVAAAATDAQSTSALATLSGFVVEP
jgi:general secretion pathway protein I